MRICRTKLNLARALQRSTETRITRLKKLSDIKALENSTKKDALGYCKPVSPKL